MKQNRKHNFIPVVLDVFEYITSFIMKYYMILIVICGLMFMSTYTNTKEVADLAAEMNGSEITLIRTALIIIVLWEGFKILHDTFLHKSVIIKFICTALFIVCMVYISTITSSRSFSLKEIEVVLMFRLIAILLYRLYFSITGKKSILADQQYEAVKTAPPAMEVAEMQTTEDTPEKATTEE